MGLYTEFVWNKVGFGYAYGPILNEIVFFKRSLVFIYDCVLGKLAGGFLNSINRNLKIIEYSKSFNLVFNRFFKALYNKLVVVFVQK